ncbi:ATP-binding protein [Thalassospira sp.]|uniref:AAA family ATPase n=1 Tax=Thalassospira sp. TaxID=1912094 RepID=UPI0027375DB5|nr:ATP-binding protein [Thalassospira sp.]MDP2698420.1 ATP-binding protein [Thalassospira sp.]
MGNSPTFSLTLIRGLPGSGKSTLAQQICPARDAVHLEADMFMVDAAGKYVFDRRKLKDVHARCEQECADHLRHGRSVVVSNTFSQIWEMQPYIDMTARWTIPLQIIECHGNFANIHDVPDDRITAMQDRWETLPQILLRR